MAWHAGWTRCWANASPHDGALECLLALDNEHAIELSWLSASSCLAVRPRLLPAHDCDVYAFVLAFDQRADCDSPTFLWFRTRYRQFVHVDRIAVASFAGDAVLRGSSMPTGSTRLAPWRRARRMRGQR